MMAKYNTMITASVTSIPMCSSGWNSNAFGLCVGQLRHAVRVRRVHRDQRSVRKVLPARANSLNAGFLTYLTSARTLIISEETNEVRNM